MYDISSFRQHAVRVITFEDRFLTVEKKFFCEKPTEKTVKVTVRDVKGGTEFVETPKITCQYPIVEIFDLSQEHATNKPKNVPFEVIDPMSTLAELSAGGTRKPYLAELWLPVNDPYFFEVTNFILNY